MFPAPLRRSFRVAFKLLDQFYFEFSAVIAPVHFLTSHLQFSITGFEEVSFQLGLLTGVRSNSSLGYNAVTNCLIRVRIS
jgi:hypothetical protein